MNRSVTNLNNKLNSSMKRTKGTLKERDILLTKIRNQLRVMEESTEDLLKSTNNDNIMINQSLSEFSENRSSVLEKSITLEDIDKEIHNIKQEIEETSNRIKENYLLLKSNSADFLNQFRDSVRKENFYKEQITLLELENECLRNQFIKNL